MLLAALLVVLPLFQDTREATPIAPDGELREIELGGDPLHFRLELGEPGRLFVFARSEDVRTVLEVANDSGRVVARDEGEARHAAFVELEAPAGALHLIVAGGAPDARAAAQLRAVVAVETEVTRLLHEIAREELAGIGTPGSAAEVAEVEARLLPLLHEIEVTPGAERSFLLAELCYDIGRFALLSHLLETAKSALSFTLAFRERTLPPEDLGTERVRGGLGNALLRTGDPRGALPHMETAYQVLARVLPEDHPDRLTAMQNLAVTCEALGDLERGLALEEQVLAIRERVLPEAHPELLSARMNLAATLGELGELARAAELLEDVVADYERTGPEENLFLQRARLNLAAMIGDLGERQTAIDLQLQALEVLERILPVYDPELSRVRLNIAASLQDLGDYRGSREMLEDTLAGFEAVYADDHPDLQRARMNLAATLQNLGDHAGARALLERAVVVFSRSLGPRHLDLQRARMNLASVRRELGDLDGARQLCEAAMAVLDESVAPDHPARREVGHTLASLLSEQGRASESRALLEEIIAASSLPPGHIELQRLRMSLASLLEELGDLEEARVLRRAGLAALSAALPAHDREVRAARRSLTRILIGLERFDDAEAEAGALSSALVEAGSELVLEHAPRELGSLAGSFKHDVGILVSLALGVRGRDPDPTLAAAAFAASESTRALGFVAARTTARVAALPEAARARAALKEVSAELARLVAEGAEADRVARARRAGDAARRGLGAVLADTGRAPDLRLDLSRVAPCLAGAGAVAYRRCLIDDWTGDAALPRVAEHMIAFVIDATRAVQVVDLGPSAELDAAVGAWRTSLGVGAASRGITQTSAAAEDERDRGVRLRELVWTPVREALGDVRRIVLVPDDVLHLVPFDALPIDTEDGGERLGDGLVIETQTTLWELVAPLPAADASPALVALGGADYDARPTTSDDAPDGAPEPGSGAYSSLRSGRSAFGELPGASLEAREIAALWREVRGDTVTLLEGSAASRRSLAALAPGATHLHFATHGWFAPESVPSEADDEPLDRQLGLVAGMTAREQIAGTAPMLLCGIALAGANQPPDRLGRVSGLLTAEELASWDLSNCELAVLSACETSVGLRRAGVGVASLQSALHYAGVRTALTTLWRVPDEATRMLMVEFYRRALIEGEPRGRALWEAKRVLRRMRDARGGPRFATRDWAGWVLTGAGE